MKGYFLLVSVTLIAWSGIGFKPMAQQTEATPINKQLVNGQVYVPLLTVNIEPTSSEIMVNQSIHLAVEGNKDFYLYLFAVQQDSQMAQLVFPTSDKQANRFHFSSQSIVPPLEQKLIATEAGKESILAIASVNKIDWSLAEGKSADHYPSTQLTSVMEQLSATTNVLNITKQPLQTAELHVQTIILDISETVQTSSIVSTASTAQQLPTVFSGLDRQKYAVGDKATIVFGATEAGFAHVFVANQSGELTLLTQQSVDGQGYYSIEADVTAPIGLHSVLVTYSEEQDVDLPTLQAQFNTHHLLGTTKGLSMPNDKPDFAYSVSYFHINKRG